jgi:hypothetical protein
VEARKKGRADERFFAWHDRLIFPFNGFLSLALSHRLTTTLEILRPLMPFFSFSKGIVLHVLLWLGEGHGLLDLFPSSFHDSHIIPYTSVPKSPSHNAITTLVSSSDHPNP